MQLSDMQTRVAARLDEIAGPAFYPLDRITSALNEAQRFFVLLTLGLETTAGFPLTANTLCYHMRPTFEDWILPLRVYLNGARLRPVRIEDLVALDANWQTTTGTPQRYCALGFDFFIVYPQPAAGGNTLQITYTRAPLPLTAPADTPEIPEQFHAGLVDYGVYRNRMPEGGQEFAKTLPHFNRFLDEAKKYAEYVKARTAAWRYDKLPFEIERYDRSRLVTLRPDLVPARKS